MNQGQILSEIKKKVLECDKNGLPNICERANSGENGLNYIVNRVIAQVTKENQSIDSALVHIESELDEIV